MELLGKKGRAVIVAVAPPGRRTASLDLHRAGKPNLDDMITTRYRLGEIDVGFDDLRAARNVRGLIVCDD